MCVILRNVCVMLHNYCYVTFWKTLSKPEALNGTCTFKLPEPVSVFHAYKGFALPDEADFSQTIYTFTFPYIEENLARVHH